VKIDDLDKQIIKLLSRDGRMSFTEIAQRLNVTEKTIRARYNNLIEKKILEVVGIVNPISLGVKVGSIIQIKVLPTKLMNIVEQLKAKKEIRYITLTSGDYQLLIQINLKDYDELTKVVKELMNMDGIIGTNVMMQMDVYKNTFDYI
jgi:Lrp/AsnC family transcriptional regulator for asnA, asnC and gidA